MKSHLGLVVGILGTLILTCCSGSSENKKIKETVQPVINDLPAMMITKLDGAQIDMRTLKGKHVLILFQPDCDHCQREAQEIRKHINAFRDYSIYFISADPMPAIKKFGEEYQLINQPNIYFASTTVEQVINNFGPISAPSVYIYWDQRLVQKFNGEVEIEKILQVI